MDAKTEQELAVLNTRLDAVVDNTEARNKALHSAYAAEAAQNREVLERKFTEIHRDFGNRFAELRSDIEKSSAEDSRREARQFKDYVAIAATAAVVTIGAIGLIVALFARQPVMVLPVVAQVPLAMVVPATPANAQ